jgi:predicted ArsR family transcriptional regulator
LQPVSAVPANLRLANQAALLGQLLGRKAASRAELAKATGMSKPTTGKIIDDLMHAGVVEEIKLMDGGRPSVGRPGKQLRLATNRSRSWTWASRTPASPACRRRRPSRNAGI